MGFRHRIRPCFRAGPSPQSGGIAMLFAMAWIGIALSAAPTNDNDRRPADAPRGEASGPAAGATAAGNAKGPAKQAAPPAASPAGKDADVDKPFEWGGTPVTDPETDRSLRRAGSLVAEGSYGEAAAMYQQVLDQSGNLMVLAVSRDVATSPTGVAERIFRPLREHVERQLADPERHALLSAYRRSADPEARSLLNAPGNFPPEETLREIVRRFFMSSAGDDAAYQLGCRLLDRYQFNAARRLFEKVLTQHPDSSVPRNDLLLRLAIAAARAGDGPGAENALAELVPDAAANVPTATLARLKEDIAACAPSSGTETEAWPMALGTPARNGRMKPLSDVEAHRGAFWKEAWHHDSKLEMTTGGATTEIRFGVAGPGDPLPPVRGAIVHRWRKHGWFPAGDVLLDAGRVYFRTRTFRDSQSTDAVPGLVCLDATTGRVLWFTREQIPGPDVGFERMRSMRFSSIGASDRPTTVEEMEFFDADLSRSLALHDGMVYCLEGRLPLASGDGMFMSVERFAMEGHALAAIDAQTGEVRWRVVGFPRRVQERVQGMGLQPAEPGPEDIVFLAVPTKVGPRLLVPVLHKQTLSLRALAPEDGRLSWEKPLCHEPGSLSRSTPVALAVEAGDAYVATGAGLVLSLGAADGEVHWAARYPSDVPRDFAARRAGFFAGPARRMDGWARDVVIPCGGKLLVMPSDSKKILYFNRHSGDLEGCLDRCESRYVLGVLRDRLLVAGNQQVACYSVKEPKQIWNIGSEQGILGSVGRGALTDRYLYIPVGDKLVLLDPNTGAAIHRVCIDNSPPDPIGNLVCDGKNLIVAGMERTYALVDGRECWAQLGERIEKGDVGAMLTRARLRERIGQAEESFADLRLAFQTSQAAPEKQAIADQLVDRLLAQPFRDSRDTACVDEAARFAQSPQQRARVELARAQRLVDVGQPMEAIPVLLPLILDPRAALVPLDGDDGRCRALSSHIASSQLREVIRRELESAGETVIQRVKAELARSEQRIEELKQGSNAYPAALLQVAEALAGTDAAIELVQAASEYLRKQGSTELIEVVLRQWERSPHGGSAALATAGLAALYEQLGWTLDAADRWQRLASASAGVEMPGGNGRTAERVAEDELRRLAIPRTDIAAPARRFPAPPWKELWRLEYGDAAIGWGTAGGKFSRFLENHALYYSGRDAGLQCIDVRTGKSLWSMPSEGQRLGVHSSNGRVFVVGGWYFPGGNVLRDAHLAVVGTPGRMHVMSLVSGKEILLAQAAPVPPGPSPEEAVRAAGAFDRDPPSGSPTVFDFADGVLAEIAFGFENHNSCVRVWDLASGSVRWERDFGYEPLYGVKVVADAVAVLGMDGELHVCDRTSGARLGRFSLKGSAPLGRTVFTPDGVVCCAGDELALRRLPLGTTVWRIPLGATHVSSLSRIDADTLCVAGQQVAGGSRVLLVDARNGKVTVDVPLGALGASVQSLVVSPDRQRMYVRCFDAGGRQQLVIIDVAAGKRLASLSLGSLSQQLESDDLVHEGDVLPLAVGDFSRQLGNNGNVERLTPNSTILFLRKSDGKVLKGLQLPQTSQDIRFPMHRAAKVRGSVLLVHSSWGVVAFGHDPNGKPPQIEE